jgi:hypothetical protein
MSFLLHELVAHYLSLKHPGVYKVGTEKTEKDILFALMNPVSAEKFMDPSQRKTPEWLKNKQ